jgi:hypothetical protein
VRKGATAERIGASYECRGRGGFVADLGTDWLQSKLNRRLSIPRTRRGRDALARTGEAGNSGTVGILSAKKWPQTFRCTTPIENI